MFDILNSLRHSSGIATSFTVQSNPRSTHLLEDQESASSLSVINHTDLSYHTLEEDCRPPTSDPRYYLLRLENQTNNHPRQDLRHHILPINRINNSLKHSAFTRIWELTRLTHTSTDTKFEVSKEFIELNPHRILNSTQIKHRSFPSPFCCNYFTNNLHWRTSIWPPMGKCNLLEPYFWSETQNHFLELMILFSARFMIWFFVKCNFSSKDIAVAMVSENVIQPDDLRITQLLATLSDCCE